MVYDKAYNDTPEERNKYYNGNKEKNNYLFKHCSNYPFLFYIFD